MEEESATESELYMPESDQHFQDGGVPPAKAENPAPIAAAEMFDVTLDQPTNIPSSDKDSEALINVEEPVENVSAAASQTKNVDGELQSPVSVSPLKSPNVALDNTVNKATEESVQTVQDGGTHESEAISSAQIESAAPVREADIVNPATSAETQTDQGREQQLKADTNLEPVTVSSSTEADMSPSKPTRIPSPTRTKIPTSTGAKPVTTTADTTTTAQPTLPANQPVQFTTQIVPTFHQPTESASSNPPTTTQPANRPNDTPSEPPANQPANRPTPANQPANKPQLTATNDSTPQPVEPQPTQTRIPKLTTVTKSQPVAKEPAKVIPAQTEATDSISSVQQPQGEITLFFTHGSFYSQKVLLALYERDVIFTPRVVVNKNEQYEPWFLEINSKAEIPVLKVGNKYITESEVIINYIGRLSASTESTGNQTLLGDISSPKGQAIQRFRRLVDGVNVVLLTFGVVFHPQLSYGTINWPAFQLDAMKDGASTMLSTLSGLTEKYPDQRSIYLALTEKHSQRFELINDIEAVSRELDHVRRVLTAVEEQLAKTKPTDDETGSWWLCGPDFTAADINLVVLLTRLHKLGLDANFLKDDLSLVRDYYIRASQRPSYQRMLKEWRRSNSTAIPYIIHGSKRLLPYVGGATAIGVVAGVAYWVYKKVT